MEFALEFTQRGAAAGIKVASSDIVIYAIHTK